MDDIDDRLRQALDHYDRGELDEAERLCREILWSCPTESAAYQIMGLISLQRGTPDQAIKWLEQAVAANERDPEAWNDLGDARQRAGKVDSAMIAFDQAIRLAPDYAEAHSNLGFMLFRRGDFAESLAPLRRAMELAPDFALAALNLSSSLLALGRDNEAVDVLLHALAYQHSDIDLHINLGQALRRCERHADALAILNRGIQLSPNRSALWLNLGAVYKDLNELAPAISAYRRAIEITPHYAEAHWNLSLALLAQGNFAAGWPEYEWRRRIRGIGPDRLPDDSPEWTGENLHDRSILLVAEQGLGDTLQFIRYAALLRELGGRVIAAVPRCLFPILQSCAEIDSLVNVSDPFPPHDCHAPLMTLPLRLTPDIASIPTGRPYLSAADPLHERWRSTLREKDGYRVGIAWQGNPNYAADRYRSVPLRHFAPLAEVPGVRLISLQQGAGTNQLADAASLFPIEIPGTGLDTLSGPFMDTAAILQNLDLLIASDSALVHLAGALGVPTWMPTSACPDWRWFQERMDSPWYPSLQLYRQPQRLEWASVFATMSQDLRKRIS